MNILEKFQLMTKGKISKIGIGLGELESQNKIILDASLRFLKDYTSTISFFGTEQAIMQLKSKRGYQKNQSRLKLVISHDLEKEILEQLNSNQIDSIVRGALNSSKFLKELKEKFHHHNINRLALLETYDGVQFFYGPVGIDECNTYEKKIEFLKKAIKQLEYLQITPKISVLSGGRKSDLGRDLKVDDTIKIAIDVVDYFKKETPSLELIHDEILIENSIERKANLIVAPEGISGNLIYRTLVHLGGGKAYGAIYMGLNQTIIDTSRVGNLSEIYGALVLALALSN